MIYKYIRISCQSYRSVLLGGTYYMSQPLYHTARGVMIKRENIVNGICNFNVSILHRQLCSSADKNDFLHEGAILVDNVHKRNVSPSDELRPKYYDIKGFQLPYNKTMSLVEDFLNKCSVTAVQWDNVLDNNIGIFKDLKYPVKLEVFDTVLMALCMKYNRLDIATSYINYHNGKNPSLDLNFVAQSWYLLLLGKNIDDIDIKEFRRNYDLLKQKLDLLPYEILCRIIKAVSLTAYWEDGFGYLSSILRVDSNITAYSINAYNDMAMAVLREKGIDAGIGYLTEHIANGITINKDTWISLMNTFEREQCLEERDRNLAKFFDILLLQKSPLDITVVEYLKNITSGNWILKKVQIPNRKACPNCNHSLEILSLTSQDIINLKEACESAIIHREDIYQTTTPKEWQNFQKFLTKCGPFDIVLDGLNILLNRSKTNPVQIIAEMVVRQMDKKILIVARVHAKRMLEKVFSIKPRNLFIYFVNQYSQDDAFLLYAAFYSGLGTKLITSDYLRNHKYLIGKKNLYECFETWQKLHQIMLNTHEQIYQYNRVPQWTICDQIFHIPIDVPMKKDEDYFSNRTKDQWLCIKKPKK